VHKRVSGTTTINAQPHRVGAAPARTWRAGVGVADCCCTARHAERERESSSRAWRGGRGRGGRAFRDAARGHRVRWCRGCATVGYGPPAPRHGTHVTPFSHARLRHGAGLPPRRRAIEDREGLHRLRGRGGAHSYRAERGGLPLQPLRYEILRAVNAPAPGRAARCPRAPRPPPRRRRRSRWRAGGGSRHTARDTAQAASYYTV
jgi:hypothetical protein